MTSPATPDLAGGVAVPTRRETAPAWITLYLSGGACEWLVRPLETAIARAADAAAGQELRLERIRREDLRKMGQEPDPAELNIDDPRVAYGVWQAAYIRHVGRIAVMDWRRMNDADRDPPVPVPFSLEVLDAVLRVPEFAAAFDRAYLEPRRVRSAEKNGSGLASPGKAGAGLTPAAPAAPPTTNVSSSPSSAPPGSSSTATGPVAPTAPISSTRP